MSVIYSRSATIWREFAWGIRRAADVVRGILAGEECGWEWK